ncbi:hypothetical protein P12x_003245 [Tundrisphaera lichenicola]|uniref:hypothetical protein n=1 Tax=Tundrisphaera lichenicola TaxID=2029860 RepID=UPI003EB8CCE6
MEKPSLAERLIAPLTLLEKSRGWKRRGLALLYVMTALVVGSFIWRELSVWRLRNVPEPFDAAKYGRLSIPDANNALVAYQLVIDKFGKLETRGYQAPPKAWEVSDWAKADPEVRRWVEDHRIALPAWLLAGERTDALLVEPEGRRSSMLLGAVQELPPYVRLALLEGSRLEQSGDLSGAWSMYLGALRASRHAGGHGGWSERQYGNSFLKLARARIETWIENPGLTPDHFRRAIVDVEACSAMTSPASEMVRAEYFSALDALSRPEEWPNMIDDGPDSRMDPINQFEIVRWGRLFLRREPERSRRVLRLIVAGYLAQCDQPPTSRPKLVSPEFMIYDHDHRTPRAVRAMSPAELEAWAKSSTKIGFWNFSNLLQALVDSEPGVLDHLRLRMAERAFEIEHGRLPKTYGELLGPYLNSLPDGIEPDDPANPGAG